MKYVLSQPCVDSNTIRNLQKRRKAVNDKPSRLKDLAILFFEQFKGFYPMVMLHENEKRFQESYTAMVGDFEIKLIILSYNESDVVPSVVLTHETVRQIYALRAALVNFPTKTNRKALQQVLEMPTKIFVQCGDNCEFQTDIDEGIWGLWLCDKKNRTSAYLQITHETLLGDGGHRSKTQQHS